MWTQPEAVTASYDARNRNPQWTYDASAHLISMNEAMTYSVHPYQAAQHTYDAAGRHVGVTQTTTRYEGNSFVTTFVNNTQSYDGDGRQVRSVEGRTLYGSPGANSLKTTYYLRSSVLGGRTVTEYDASGERCVSYSYLGGEVLSETTKDAQGAVSQQQWRQTNPVTGDAINTDGQGVQTGVTRLDPTGVNVGASDPFTDLGGGGGWESPMEAERVGLWPVEAGWGGGEGGNRGMRCNLDGVEIGCGWAIRMMDIGAAARCSNDDCGPRVQTVTARDGEGRVIGSSSRIILPGQPGWDGSFDGTYRRGEVPRGDMTIVWGGGIFNRVSGGSGSIDPFAFASFFAPPQSSKRDFLFGRLANFSEKEREALSRAFEKISSENCQKFFDAKVAKLIKDGVIDKSSDRLALRPSTLKALLNVTTFNRYTSSLTSRQVGVSERRWSEVHNQFESNPNTNAVTVAGLPYVFIGDHSFYEASVWGRVAGRESTDLAGVIVHELFHVAGLGRDKESVIRGMHSDIQRYCGRPELLLD